MHDRQDITNQLKEEGLYQGSLTPTQPLLKDYQEKLAKLPNTLPKDPDSKRSLVSALIMADERLSWFKTLHQVYHGEYFEIPLLFNQFKAFLEKEKTYASLFKSFEFTDNAMRLRKPLSEIPPETWALFVNAKMVYLANHPDENTFANSFHTAPLNELPLQLTALQNASSELFDLDRWDHVVYLKKKKTTLIDYKTDFDNILFEQTYARFILKINDIKKRIPDQFASFRDDLDIFQEYIQHIYETKKVKASTLRQELFDLIEFLDGNRDVNAFLEHSKNLCLRSPDAAYAWLGGFMLALASVGLIIGIVLSISTGPCAMIVGGIGAVGLLSTIAATKPSDVKEVEKRESKIVKEVAENQTLQAMLSPKL